MNLENICYQLPITVDYNKLIFEIKYIIGPDEKWIGGGYNITNLADTPREKWFVSNRGSMTRIFDPAKKEFLTKSYINYTLGFPGGWRDNLIASYDSGVSDIELIHWPTFIPLSEIKTLERKIANYFQIETSLRCRASFFRGPKQWPAHSDPHTPWRVHINLKSGPNTKWIFINRKTLQQIEWKQPEQSVWLIRTGNVQHAINTDEGECRWHLFFHIWQSNLGDKYYNEWKNEAY